MDSHAPACRERADCARVAARRKSSSCPETVAPAQSRIGKNALNPQRSRFYCRQRRAGLKYCDASQAAPHAAGTGRARPRCGDGVVDTVLGLTDTGTGLLDGLLCDIVQAGMPADLFIETGERTFFDYLMRPLLDSFLRAFREH